MEDKEKQMKFDLPDIDIDCSNREKVLEKLDYVNAAIIKDGEIRKHNTGIYITDIPNDPRTNTCTFDYKEAEDRGYIKLDILNVHVYENVRNEEHLNELMAKEPNWQRLWTDREFCEKIIHINNYYDLLGKMKPDSIPRMAMFISIIRPGKKHLIGRPWKEIAETVWEKDEDSGYAFKKAHSISYAELVRVHMNLIEEISS